MLKKVIIGSVIAASVAVTSSAFAASAVNDSDGNLIGINDIKLGKFGAYNVKFIDFLSLESDSAILGNTGFAKKANNKLDDILTKKYFNSNYKYGWNADGDLSFADSDPFALVPTSTEYLSIFTLAWNKAGTKVKYAGLELGMYGDILNIGSSPLPTFNIGDIEYDDSRSYLQAQWTQVSAVPVPAAAILFAPALLGFLGLRRKQKLQG